MAEQSVAEQKKQAGTEIYCGISFDLGDQKINLNPKTALNKVKTEGLECALPDRVRLGEVKGMFDDVVDALGQTYTWSDLSKDIGTIPILSGAVRVLGEADLYVEQFHMKLPPKYKTGPSPAYETLEIADEELEENKYTVGLSMLWGEGEGELFGKLKLSGLFFKVSNEVNG